MNTAMKLLFIVALLNNLACLFSIYKLAKLCNLTNGFVSFVFDVNSKKIKSFLAHVWLFKKINVSNNGKFLLLFSRTTGILNIILILILGVMIIHYSKNATILIPFTIIMVLNLIVMYKQLNKWIE